MPATSVTGCGWRSPRSSGAAQRTATLAKSARTSRMKRVRRYPIASSSGPWSKATTTVAPIAVSHQNAKASARAPDARLGEAGPQPVLLEPHMRVLVGDDAGGHRPHNGIGTRRRPARRNTTAQPLRRRSTPSTRSAVPSACATARRPHPTSACASADRRDSRAGAAAAQRAAVLLPRKARRPADIRDHRLVRPCAAAVHRHRSRRAGTGGPIRSAGDAPTRGSRQRSSNAMAASVRGVHLTRSARNASPTGRRCRPYCAHRPVASWPPG